MKRSIAAILCLSLISGCQQLARISGRMGLESKSVVLRADSSLPLQFSWPDRRPIGILFVSQSNLRTPANPCGWIDGPDWVEKYLARALPVLKEINAQAAIFWDIEGSEINAPGDYVGAPDLAEAMNPTQAHGYGLLFSRLRAAGIIPGVCIRPDEFNAATGQHSTAADPFATLLRKAAYARQVWKCRVFYVDSNVWGDGQYGAAWAYPQGRLLPASIAARLHKALPDCLFIFEHEDATYHLYGAPYRELRGDETSTPAAVLADIPAAFSVINVSEGDTRGRADELRAAVGRGDILAINGWWRSPQIDDVKAIYRPLPTMDFKAGARRRLAGVR